RAQRAESRRRFAAAVRGAPRGVAPAPRERLDAGHPRPSGGGPLRGRQSARRRRLRRATTPSATHKLQASTPALAQCDPPDGVVPPSLPPCPASGAGEIPRTPWMRLQCAWQFVCTGGQVSGPRIWVNVINGWNVAVLSSLVAMLNP